MSVKYKDYYKILGVDKKATHDDIKKAFRKLAKKYHPDKNPNDKTSKSKFEEVNEAYEVLGDPDKKRTYDSLGPNWNNNRGYRTSQRSYSQDDFDFHDFMKDFKVNRGKSTGGFSDFFESIFGDRSNRRNSSGPDLYEMNYEPSSGYRRPKGKDVNAILNITLEDIYYGETKTVSVKVPVVNSIGKTEYKDKTFSIKVPKYARDGQKLRYKGEGSNVTPGGTKGDLYFELKVKKHTLFKVKGLDLYIDVPVTPSEAVFGVTVSVPTMGGRVNIKVPQGTDSGKKLRVKDKGLSHPKKGKGNLYAKILIKLPKSLSEEEKSLYRKLSELSKFDPREELDNRK